MTFEEMARLARVAARVYKRSYSWVNIEDLEQSAWVVMCEATRTWDESVGVEKEAYLWAAIMRRLWREVIKESSPVSASASLFDNLEDLKQTSGLSIDTIEEMPDPVLPSILLENQERSARMQAELNRALMRLTSLDVNVALKVLIDKQKPSQIAKLEQIPVTKIYASVRRARYAIANDRQLWETIREYR